MKRFPQVLFAAIATVLLALGCPSTPSGPDAGRDAGHELPPPPPDGGVRGSFTPIPTGTGVAHVSGGQWVTPAAGIVNADVDNAAAIAWTKLGSGSQSYAAADLTSTVNAKGTVIDRQPINVQTTDATVTSLDTFTLASNTSVALSALVAAVKSDNSEAAAYSITAVFKNNAGTVAQVGTTTTTVLAESDAAWDATIDNSTTTIRLRVTGKAATTIQWTAVYTRLQVIP